MEAKFIQKYKNKSVPQLLKIAEKYFNAFIRNRDKNGDYFYCPTCNRTKKIVLNNYHACHLFPAGHFPCLRFDERNVHGGCLSCNYYKHGAGYTFTTYVQKKIGMEEFNKMIEIKDFNQRHGFKWDRFSLIDIIIKYKSLNKTK